MVRWRPTWRFSLRTFFLLITLVCIYLGWQVAVVRERAATLLEIKRLGGVAKEMFDPYTCENFLDPPHLRLPYVRRLLGDQWVGYGSLPEGTQQAAVDRILRAFPEADVRRDYYERLRESLEGSDH